MSDSGTKNRFISDIAYHDYCALLCFTDAEWTRNRLWQTDDKSAFQKELLRPQRHVTAVCRDLKRRINYQYRQWYKANENSLPDDGLANAILNPLTFMTVGHPDDLAIVLLDDLDPIHEIASQLHIPMEEACLGWCPKRESLGQWGDHPVFCDLDRLMPGNYRKNEAGRFDEPRSPFVIFTKYRVDGLGTVGYGLPFFQNLLKALAKVVVGTVERLASQFDEYGNIKALIEDKSCITETRFSILDLQGPEDVGSLIFCNNCTVAMSIVAAIRSLTFKDVFDAELKYGVGGDTCGQLEFLFEQSEMHRAVIRLAEKLRGGDPRDCKVEKIYSSHVFRWTDSLVGIAPATFVSKGGVPVSGYARVEAEAQIPPGHRLDAEKVFDGNLVAKQAPKVEPEEYYLLDIGRRDLTSCAVEGVSKRKRHLQRIDSVVKYAYRNRMLFGCRDAAEPDTGRKVIDIETFIGVPIPKIKKGNGFEYDFPFRSVAKNHMSCLCAVLPCIKKRLCYPDRASKKNGALGPRLGKLKILELHKKMRQYALPISLRRTIEYLYQDFATILGDPFIFDSVLDLYDTLCTLHALLTKRLPDLLTENRQIIIDEDRVEQIAMLVDAIHDAMSHLMIRAYPDMPTREMGADFREGLNQVLHAADVPVKCGFGILRKYAYREHEKSRPARDRVGGLVKIAFSPGVACYSLEFGVEEEAKLAFFKVDTSHVLHVASYSDYFHETFHLILEILRAQSREGKLLSAEDSATVERINEVFANLLSLMFVFGGDGEKFLYFQLCTFSKGLARLGEDSVDTMARSVELLSRMFLVKYMVDKAGDPANWRGKWISPEETDAVDEFVGVLNEYGRFVAGFEENWVGPNRSVWETFCRKRFGTIYGLISKQLPSIWKEAFKVYSSFKGEGPFDYKEEELKSDVKQAFKEGRPLIRCNYSGDVSLQPLPLVCSMLREYIPSDALTALQGFEIHLPRSGVLRDVKFSQLRKAGRKWNYILLDHGAASTFCPVPLKRRERLLKQITVIKTFWDISSNLRGRRLWEILQDNWKQEDL